MENSMETPQKIKNRTYDLVISLWGISPGETKTLTQKDGYIPIFNAALFTLVNIRKPQNAHQRING